MLHVSEQLTRSGSPSRSMKFALTDQKGSLIWKTLGMMNQSNVRALAERASDTVRRITAGTTTWRSIGLTRFVPWYLSQLAKGFGMSERACIQLVTDTCSKRANYWGRFTSGLRKGLTRAI